MCEYQVTQLENGLTVLTESLSFPSLVSMGLLINAGSRDETSSTSGALLTLAKCQYQTLAHRDQTMNFNSIQMSGGYLSMDYDQEKVYFSA